MPMDIRFVSGNEHKIAEAAAILEASGITVKASSIKIEELQTADTQRLVRDKLLKAFEKLGRPLFVEHTGLYLEHMNGLPGGLTQVFWDGLKADRFAELFGKLAPVTAVVARTTIAYCDAFKLHTFEGAVSGKIVDTPRGPRDFQWDCVFQPDGDVQTFAEMGARKNSISMRYRALQQLADHLKEEMSR